MGNRVAGWLGLGPQRSFAACDLDVQGPHDLECLRCNRCVAAMDGGGVRCVTRDQEERGPRPFP